MRVNSFCITTLVGLLITASASFSYAEEEVPLLRAKDVPNYIADYKAQHKLLSLSFQGKEYQLNLVSIVEEGLFISFDKGLVLLGFDFNEMQPTDQVTIYEGEFDHSNLSEEAFERIDKQATQIWDGNNIAISEQNDQIVYQGFLENQNGRQTNTTVTINEPLISGGSSQITIENNKAILTGELGTSTYIQIKNLVQDSPEVDTLVIAEVRGSLNDEINVHTGYLVRKSGLNTEIPAYGYAYSGGVDLLLSGVKRTVADSAEVGVHSWCCVDDKTAADLPKNHPAHQSLVDYSAAMLGSKKGKAFYFYTLEAAPFDGVHIMKPDELKMFDVITH